MNKLTTKAKLFAALIATSALMATTVKAESMVSLDTAVEILVSQQSRMVINQVSHQIANSIEQEVANFNVDNLFTYDHGVPTVTVSAVDNQLTINDEDDSSDDASE
jgi:hypothetical protein